MINDKRFLTEVADGKKEPLENAVESNILLGSHGVSEGKVAFANIPVIRG